MKYIITIIGIVLTTGFILAKVTENESKWYVVDKMGGLVKTYDEETNVVCYHYTYKGGISCF